jgi:hypothetical protein
MARIALLWISHSLFQYKMQHGGSALSFEDESLTLEFPIVFSEPFKLLAMIDEMLYFFAFSVISFE